MAISSCLSSKIFRRFQIQKALALVDIVKQKEATQIIEKRSMNKIMAFANASHDVRASLAGIAGLIKLCYEDVPLDSDVARNLVQMDSCASKLMGILNSVLDTSKLEAGKMELEEIEFNIAQAIEESVDIFYVVARSKGLELIWDPCDFSLLKFSSVRGDCRRFKQILDNLLSNAVKFTSKGGVIVRAWAKKPCMKHSELASIHKKRFFQIPALFFRSCNIGGVFSPKKRFNSLNHDEDAMEFIFEVDDTGIGICIEKRDAVFQSYVQVKNSLSGCEGTGLGLGIVQSYVRLMGGDIGIQEKQPGESGSCFRFNIFLNPIDISSYTEDGLDSCKFSILNRFHAFSPQKRSKLQSNVKAMTISKGDILDGVQCLLLIESAVTRRILRNWMENLGIFVNVAQRPDIMYDALNMMNLNANIFKSYDSSLLPSSAEDNELSSPKDVKSHALPFSMKDASKKGIFKTLHKYLLVFIDMSFENTSELHGFIASLPKSTHHFHQYKVICLTDSVASCSQIPCDLMLFKPLHGTRFFKILELMQEFRITKDELKREIVEESSNAIELEKRRLLNSKHSQQNNMISFKLGNENEVLSGMKILLVEDAIVLRQIALKLLSRYGAIVKFAENGLEALNVVKRTLEETVHILKGSSRQLPFDLILMDCEMPIMNGYEATKCIRLEEEKYGLHIPVIALSAHATPDEAMKALLCGMDFHLTKPFEISKLIKAILLISPK